MSPETIGCDVGEPRRTMIEAGGISLSYLEWGKAGKPALLLHGITSSARGWWRVAPQLAARGYHVFAVDMPGHGESGDTTDHTLEGLATTVSALLALPALENALLIGHSWGGAVALTIAAGAHNGALPQRVVLVDPAMRMDPDLGTYALPRYSGGVGDPPEVTLPQLQVANPQWHACDHYWKAEALDRCRMSAVEGLFLQSGHWNLLGRLGEAAMPLLLVVADPQYTVIPPEILEAADQAVRPGLGQVVIVPGSAHNLFRTSFEPFMQVLLPWLESPIA